MHASSPRHDAELDASIRDAVDAGLDLHDSMERSRYEAAFRLDDAIADEVRAGRAVARPRRSRRAALAIVGGLAAALLVAGALAPGFGSDPETGGGSSAPFVAANASAAEVLEQAAKRMLASGAEVGGSGPAWHAVATTASGGTWESWYDAERRTARWAMYQPPGSGVVGVQEPGDAIPATYYVLSVSDGATTIRQYQRIDGSWTPQPGGSQMNESAEVPEASLAGSAELEALAWLRAVDAADEPADLRTANERFAERTHMWFSPPTADRGKLGEDVDAARALQVLYLMRIARLQPEAVAQLYRDVLDIEGLERLDDGTVDGRDVLRLRLFDPPAEGHIASVLLLDERTGEPVGVEATDGTERELFDAPRRTSEVGAEPQSCGNGPLPPCELLRGTGPVVAAANRIATDVSAPIDPTPGPGDPEDSVAAPVAPAPS